MLFHNVTQAPFWLTLVFYIACLLNKQTINHVSGLLLRMKDFLFSIAWILHDESERLLSVRKPESENSKCLSWQRLSGSAQCWRSKVRPVQTLKVWHTGFSDDRQTCWENMSEKPPYMVQLHRDIYIYVGENKSTVRLLQSNTKSSILILIHR